MAVPDRVAGRSPKSSLLDARLKNSATMSFAPDVLRCTLSFPGLGDVLLSLTGPKCTVWMTAMNA